MSGSFKSTMALAMVLWTGVATAATQPPLRIGWQELRPARPATGTAAAAGAESNRPEEALSAGLEGQAVEIEGYLLPVDREGDLVYEFLLVPWAGACSHMAQPPPNQIVHVFPEKPFRASASYEPVSISGTMRLELEKTQLFIMDGVLVVESGYRIGRAQVAKSDGANLAPAHQSNPWRSITK
jgi:hypothetical protein